jgi:hypothetical protein
VTHAWSAGDRSLRWLGVVAWLATVTLSIAALALRTTSAAPALPNRFGLTDIAIIGFAVLQVACASVALVIVSRLPRNLVAWLLFGIGLGYAISIVAAALVFETAGEDGAITRPDLAWLAQIGAQIPGVLTFVFVFVYPDVRALSRRGRRLALVMSVAIALGIALIAVHPGPLFFWPQLNNPVGIGPWELLDPAGDLIPITVGLGSVGLAAVAWIAWRYYTSTGVERLQLKWFVSASIVTLAALSMLVLIRGTARSGATPEWPLVVFAASMTLVPVAVGIAILRYHLYAIDRIINRVLVYSAVTALLAGVFAIVTVVVGGTLATVTPENQTVAVALSTLIVASLFSPIRQRIQRAVDRRFYRARYDANMTVDRFAERLRRTLDLDELRGEVQAVVADTLHPTTVGVWLHPSTRGPRHRHAEVLEA